MPLTARGSVPVILPTIVTCCQRVFASALYLQAAPISSSFFTESTTGLLIARSSLESSLSFSFRLLDWHALSAASRLRPYHSFLMDSTKTYYISGNNRIGMPDKSSSTTNTESPQHHSCRSQNPFIASTSRKWERIFLFSVCIHRKTKNMVSACVLQLPP